MTYVSPIDTNVEDPEIDAMERVSELREEKFDFSMFFVLGLVLILIGFFRMVFFNELSWLNVGFVALGFVISLSSQTWMRGKELTVKEKELINRRIEIQYELADGDAGFREQDMRNKKRQEYLANLEKQGSKPDVKHTERFVDATTQAPQDPDEQYIRRD